MDKYKFGEFIYNLRIANHLTQDELGRKIGVTNKAVSKWEVGETLPDVSESKLEAFLPANNILPTNISNKFSFISKANVPITTTTINKYFILRLNCFPKIM